MARGRAEVAAAVVERLRAIVRDLPEAYEEPAWVGTRWRIRSHTFAHVVQIEAGWPPAYARASTIEGPATVLTFRSSSPELEVLEAAGLPYFRCNWGRDDVGIVLDDATDWDEVAELVTESYCLLAPKKLAALVTPSNP